MHPNLIAALVEDRHRCCPCSAVNDQLQSPCRGCLARMDWRRCSDQSSWRAARRHASRQARGPAWIFAVAASMLRTFGKGAGS
jgi:hypothetical protein